MTRVIFLIIILVVISCNSGEYSDLAGKIEKQLVAFGEGHTAVSEAKYLDLEYVISKADFENSVQYSNQLFLSDFHPSIFGTSNFQTDFSKLRSGDSVIYRLPYSVIKDQILDEFSTNEILLADTALVMIHLLVNLAMTEEEFLDFTQKQVKEGLEEEMTLINNYLSNKNLTDRVIQKGDLHYLKTSETNATKVNIGNDIAIAYTCSFLNDEVFDRIPSDSPLYISLGSPDQVVPGMESVIKELREGETARVIIPSYLAFGMNGSTDGKVPPKTPIIVDVQLVEIVNSK